MIQCALDRLVPPLKMTEQPGASDALDAPRRTSVTQKSFSRCAAANASHATSSRTGPARRTSMTATSVGVRSRMLRSTDHETKWVAGGVSGSALQLRWSRRMAPGSSSRGALSQTGGEAQHQFQRLRR